MHMKRTVPPAAAPLYVRDIMSGILAIRRGRQELERFRAELKDYFGVRHCFLVSSGKAALTLILKALKTLYPYKNQVVIPAYTCFSVPSAIVRAGLEISLCDMDDKILDFDYTQLSNLLQSPDAQSNKPKQPATPFLAIIPAHLYGIPSDVDSVRSLLGDDDVVIVEDAAQAMGGKTNGKLLGTLGDVSFFSLGRGKALSTVEGGIILTNREDIADQISSFLSKTPAYTAPELFRLIIEAVVLNLFMRPTLFWLPKSLPFLKLGETIYDPDFKIRRMHPFQAGIARNWQAKLKEFQIIRKACAKSWSKITEQLNTHERLSINPLPESDLIRFPIRVKHSSLRKAILNQSNQKGLGIMPGYPNAIDGIFALRGAFAGQAYPVARQYTQQLITLPIHPYITKDDRIGILDLILKAFSKCGG
jgi:perosamine synthetase